MNQGFSGRLPTSLLVWMLAGMVAGGSVFLRTELPWLVSYPEAWVIPVADWANAGMAWFIEHFRWFFRLITWLLSWAMTWILGLLAWLPWPATIAVFVGIALITGG